MNEQIATSVSEHTSNAVGTAVSTAVSAAVSSAVRSAAAITTPSALRQLLSQQDTQKAGKDDERPALLAKILATESSPNLRRIAAWGLADYAEKPVAAEALASQSGA